MAECRAVARHLLLAEPQSNVGRAIGHLVELLVESVPQLLVARRNRLAVRLGRKGALHVREVQHGQLLHRRVVLGVPLALHRAQRGKLLVEEVVVVNLVRLANFRLLLLHLLLLLVLGLGNHLFVDAIRLLGNVLQNLLLLHHNRIVRVVLAIVLHPIRLHALIRRGADRVKGGDRLHHRLLLILQELVFARHHIVELVEHIWIANGAPALHVEVDEHLQERVAGRHGARQRARQRHVHRVVRLLAHGRPRVEPKALFLVDNPRALLVALLPLLRRPNAKGARDLVNVRVNVDLVGVHVHGRAVEVHQSRRQPIHHRAEEVLVRERMLAAVAALRIRSKALVHPASGHRLVKVGHHGAPRTLVRAARVEVDDLLVGGLIGNHRVQQARRLFHVDGAQVAAHQELPNLLVLLDRLLVAFHGRAVRHARLVEVHGILTKDFANELRIGMLLVILELENAHRQHLGLVARAHLFVAHGVHGHIDFGILRRDEDVSVAARHPLLLAIVFFARIFGMAAARKPLGGARPRQGQQRRRRRAPHGIGLILAHVPNALRIVLKHFDGDVLAGDAHRDGLRALLQGVAILHPARLRIGRVAKVWRHGRNVAIQKARIVAFPVLHRRAHGRPIVLLPAARRPFALRAASTGARKVICGLPSLPTIVKVLAIHASGGRPRASIIGKSILASPGLRRLLHSLVVRARRLRLFFSAHVEEHLIVQAVHRPHDLLFTTLCAECVFG